MTEHVDHQRFAKVSAQQKVNWIFFSYLTNFRWNDPVHSLQYSGGATQEFVVLKVQCELIFFWREGGVTLTSPLYLSDCFSLIKKVILHHSLSPLSLQRTKRNSAAQSLTSVSMRVIRRTILFLSVLPTSGLFFTSRSGGSTLNTTHT